MYDLFFSDLGDLHRVSENHDDLELFIQRINHLLNSLFPCEVQPPCDRPPYKAHGCAESKALRNVGAPSYPTVYVYLDLRVSLVDCLIYLFKHANSRGKSVHLAASIVGNPDCICS